MGDLKFTLDTALFDRAVLRYVEELGIAFPQAVKTAARLLAEDLLRLTPPKSQSQGRKAVARDIGRAMFLLDPKKIHNEALQKAVLFQDFDTVEAILKNVRNKGGAFSTSRLAHFSPELHQNVRDRRGRVTRSKGVLVLERPAYLRYVREVQGRVGSTKYAWGVGARRLGSSVPDWILKHSAVHGGIEEDYNPKTPSVTLTNRGVGIDNLTGGKVQTAVNRRTKAMTRDVEQILAGRASRVFN